MRERIWDERRPLERLVQILPGFRGYAARGSRRDSDRLLRIFALSRMDRILTELERARKAAAPKLQIHYGRIVADLEAIHRELREEDPYRSFFGHLRWESPDALETLYARDEEIVRSFVALTVATAEETCTLDEIGREIRRLARALRERRGEIGDLIEQGRTAE